MTDNVLRHQAYHVITILDRNLVLHLYTIISHNCSIKLLLTLVNGSKIE